MVPINNETATADPSLEEFIGNFKNKLDEKYNAVITRFSEKLTHPERVEETTLGNIVADALAELSETDIILVGSGSVRVKELGPVVTLGDLKACFPYDDSLARYTIKGKQLRKIFSHIMRIKNRDGEGECYQINSRVKAVYSDNGSNLISITVDEAPVVDDQNYTITLQGYHFINSETNLGISHDELMAIRNPKVVST